jgi:hypothetical protein
MQKIWRVADLLQAKVNAFGFLYAAILDDAAPQSASVKLIQTA